LKWAARRVAEFKQTICAGDPSPRAVRVGVRSRADASPLPHAAPMCARGDGSPGTDPADEPREQTKRASSRSSQRIRRRVNRSRGASSLFTRREECKNDVGGAPGRGPGADREREGALGRRAERKSSVDMS
jgi:hypothetical protein